MKKATPLAFSVFLIALSCGILVLSSSIHDSYMLTEMGLWLFKLGSVAGSFLIFKSSDVLK